MATLMKIGRIDCSSAMRAGLIRQLRRQLSPRGDVVSPQGRARTIAAFGEPLTPEQVVRQDLRRRPPSGPRSGPRLHRAARPGRPRPSTPSGSPPRSWREAFRAADPAYLRTIRRVRDNILSFQSGILHRDARLPAGQGVRAPAPLPAPPAGRRLHPRRRGGLSLVAPDDGGAGAGGGRGPDRGGRPAHALRRLQHRPPRGLPRPGRDRGPPGRRGASRGGPGVWGRGDRAGRQDRRAGQPVRRPGQAARLRRGRHRQHRRPQRGRPDRRLDRRPPVRRRRPHQPGRALPGRLDPHHLGSPT